MLWFDYYARPRTIPVGDAKLFSSSRWSYAFIWCNQRKNISVCSSMDWSRRRKFSLLKKGFFVCIENDRVYEFIYLWKKLLLFFAGSLGETHSYYALWQQNWSTWSTHRDWCIKFASHPFFTLILKKIVFQNPKMSCKFYANVTINRSSMCDKRRRWTSI